MKSRRKRLILSQLDQKLEPLKPLARVNTPTKGWIHTVRTGLGMSLRQLGKRLGKSAQSIQDFEKREVSGAITLQSLKEIAASLDLQLVYALIPKGETMEHTVVKQAYKKANEIVDRANATMHLEDQGNTDQRILKAVDEKWHELINEMPNFLWD